MPSRKAAIKDLRQSKKRQQRNIVLKKSLKKEEKKIAALIATKDTSKLKTEIPRFFSIVDKAVVKKIIHKNKASRQKSRILKRINRLSQDKSTAATTA